MKTCSSSGNSYDLGTLRSVLAAGPRLDSAKTCKSDRPRAAATAQEPPEPRHLETLARVLDVHAGRPQGAVGRDEISRALQASLVDVGSALGGSFTKLCDAAAATGRGHFPLPSDA